MRRLFIHSVFLMSLLVGLPAFGADFSKGFTAYFQGNYPAALKEFTPLAEQGNAAAQVNLGTMDRFGEGVLQDDKTARKWFTLAAEQGEASAQNNLGLMYVNGKGVLQDYAYAHMCLES